MVSTQTELPPSSSGPRISFSLDLSSSDNHGDFICINPHNVEEKDKNSSVKAGDFEFLSENTTNNQTTMLTADELFSEGKLLPFWPETKPKPTENLKNVTLKPKPETEEPKPSNEGEVVNIEKKEQQEGDNNRGNWFLDDDPSPRPPTCTVLWKELLRLKKKRSTTTTTKSTKASSLSPSSSSSSTSSSSSSIGDAVKEEIEKEGKKGKRMLERTRSMTMRIRPMIHVPICTPSKNNAPLPPMFPIRLHKEKVDRRI